MKDEISFFIPHPSSFGGLDFALSIQNDAIVVNNLTRKFGKFTAVNQISFTVARGEIFGFLGPNGSGKTTTIKMLLGLLHPTSGTASVLGYDIARHAEAIRSRVGYVSQKFSLYTDLNVIENLNFYGRAYRVWGKELEARRQSALELSGLAGCEHKVTAHLAGGFKQRLALAVAILHEPQLLFLDEPTAGVDPVSRRDFWRLLYRLAAQGTTIFVTTHYMDEAEQCHRLAFIHEGRLVATGTPSDIKAKQMRGHVIEIDCEPSGQALNVLRKIENLDEVALYGSLVHIVAHDVATQQPIIENALRDAQVTINSIGVIPPSLEDVFIARAKG
ncbi:MAG: ABC transporter ATP-binding protein [Chloroflexi bacterium]|nr:ABC transporter ATP-binding protein [Chloroflexota bacterium]